MAPDQNPNEVSGSELRKHCTGGLAERYVMDLPPFWVYILFSLKDHQFYIGTTNHLTRRAGQHERGETHSTAFRRPLVMIYCEGHCSIIDARRREKYFKTTKGRVTLKYVLRHSLDQLAVKR